MSAVDSDDIHTPASSDDDGTASEEDEEYRMPEPEVPLLWISEPPMAMIFEIAALLKELCIEDVNVHQPESRNSYSILGNVPLERKLHLIEICKVDIQLNRAMGSMCGMGVGDAVGAMFEFLPAQDRPGDDHYLDIKADPPEFHGISNKFNLKLGQWTDDASMGLCMADSLIIRRGFDGSDMRSRFFNWWFKGYNNGFRLDPERSQSIGLGSNVMTSLVSMMKVKRGERQPHAFNTSGRLLP